MNHLRCVVICLFGPLKAAAPAAENLIILESALVVQVKALTDLAASESQAATGMGEGVPNILIVRVSVRGWDPAYSVSPMKWPFDFLLLVH